MYNEKTEILYLSFLRLFHKLGMKRVISAILTLLLTSGCVVPPRQLGTSDAVADVTDSVQTESRQKAPADVCPK
jgi:PBP1b-binding outer membrane lipoprotein LpoB